MGVSGAVNCRADNVFTHRQVEGFLFDEAAHLDNWQLEEWLEFFAEDARYVVPTTDLPGGDPAQDLVFIDDNLERLRGRVRRLASRHAHREYPHSRTRRFISNVRIIECDGIEATVEASFLIYRFRAGATEPFVGQYRYRLRKLDGRLKIVSRRATLDQETLRGQGAISIIL